MLFVVVVVVVGVVVVAGVVVVVGVGDPAVGCCHCLFGIE